MSAHATWYLARAAGIVGWFLGSIGFLWGLLVSTRILGPRPKAPTLVDLHRTLSLLTLVFIGIHVGSIVTDGYVHFGLVQTFVPMTSAWRPGAVAWGIAATYLLVLIEVSSRLRRHMPERVWHAVHLLSFGSLAASTVHALQAGSDMGNPIVLAPGAALIAVITGLSGWRIRHGQVSSRQLRDELVDNRTDDVSASTGASARRSASLRS
jgi:methionine sulfoxide reductase heme-binding subunit